ncbi:MAG: hypothetical protein RL662_727 [Bacteroidota bacterium]|jgi:ligand-binding sensor domain-containing protein/signal transduction histidine kinase/DNA-binding response OmpR family regulator
MKYFQPLLFLFLLNCTLLAYPQENGYFHFKKIQVDEGLSENTVYAILQDSRGFMWFGTKDGLNRYDGSNFRIFRHTTTQQQSLANNFIRSLAEGDANTLFVGTDGGLYIMDKVSESFELLQKPSANAEHISTAVNSLLVDKQGLLWIATMYQGVFTYDYTRQKFKKIPIHKASLGQNAVWTIYQDRSGTIWAGTRLGLLRYNARAEALEPVDGLFVMKNNSDNEVLSMIEDETGKLWLGTWNDGVRCYNKQSNTYTSFFNTSSKAHYITHVRTLYQYAKNTLLIGADDGLYLFDTQTQWSKRLDVINSLHNMSDQNIYSTASDKEGGIWIGTYFGGINYLNRSLLVKEFYHHNKMPHALSGKAISQFCEDSKGNLWIASEDGGINYFDTTTKQFTQPIRTSYHNTHALLLDEDNLWIGTFSRGIDIYNTKTKSLVNFRNDNKDRNTLNDDCIFSLYRTKAGDIYVGTPVGLNKYNRLDNSFSQIPDAVGFIYDMIEDDYDNLWIANYGAGVMRYNKKNNQWTNYNHILPHSNPIVNSKLISVYIDSQKRLWFSSEGRGLFLYDYQTDKFINISENEGLPNNVVYGILDDQFGNLWLSCNKGLVSFDPSMPNEFKLYTKDDGLQSNQFNYKSSLKARDGKLYFGGINGFNAFYPQDLKLNKNKNIPPVEITQIHLLGGATSQQTKDIQIALNNKSKIELPYNKSSFSIAYVSLSYISQSKNQYAYKLVGVDKDWNYVGNNRNVTYVNLAPGKYTFKVKASNNSGEWNDEGTAVVIEILPPFWLSIPAKVFYILLSFSLLYLLLRYYTRRNQLKHERYLEAFKAEQETLSFKSKIDFFTTIAHEIRTPLSLIKAPLEEIISSKLNEDDTQQNLSVIEKNCDRLTILINQLLDFRKMDSTTYVVKPEKIDLENHLLGIVERFKKTAQSRKIELDFQTPSNGIIWVVSDADALTKITGNLLTNALKFTTDRIVLRLDTSAHHDVHTISVEDNGRGIADDQKELIFDPFYQIQNQQPNVGTGIGLSLVKHLSDVLRGKIIISDAPNGGSLFAFTFTDIAFDKQQDKEVKAEDKKVIEVSYSKPNLYTDTEKTILLVEDNEDMLRFIEKSLQSEYTVAVAADVKEAQNLLSKTSFDLIVSDIMMPGIDGISFARIVKTNTNLCHIPLILLSAKTENSVKIEGLQSGADVFIEKPFSIVYLKAQINSLLENRRVILDTFNKSPLASYTILTSNKSDADFLSKLNAEIEKHLSDVEFSIESITDTLGMSRSNLQRKVKGICGVTPGDYLRTYRLKKSCILLLENDMRINEVAYQVGFNSASYFTKCFLKQYGILPKDFSKK